MSVWKFYYFFDVRFIVFFLGINRFCMRFFLGFSRRVCFGIGILLFASFFFLERRFGVFSGFNFLIFRRVCFRKF